MKRFSLISAVLIMSALVGTGAVAAQNDWKKIGETDGIIGYTRPTSKAPVDEVKAVGMIDAPVAVVEAVIRDPHSKTEFMYNCKEAHAIISPELPSTPDIVHSYTVTHMPAPVKDRDVVTKTFYSLDKATGTLTIHSVSVDSTYGLTGKRVRMPMVNLEFIIVPKGPDKCEFTYQGYANPGGHLPAWLVNMFTKNVGIQTIAGLRTMVQKDKYRSVRNVATVTTR